jgi:hypothetical protein
MSGRLPAKPGYDSLANVLDDALHQAQSGKGEERHANDLPFDRQPMQKLIESYGVGFALGQAAKKGEESMVLEPGHDIAEILGAIVYLAGAVVYKRRKYAELHAQEAEQQKVAAGHIGGTDGSRLTDRPSNERGYCKFCGNYHGLSEPCLQVTCG